MVPFRLAAGRRWAGGAAEAVGMNNVNAAHPLSAVVERFVAMPCTLCFRADVN